MKNVWRRLGVAGLLAGLALFSRAGVVTAAEPEPGDVADRLARLERRVNELAQQQERLLRRLNVEGQRQEQPLRPPDMQAGGRERLMRRLAERGELAGPVPPVEAENVRPPLPSEPPVAAPPAAKTLHELGKLVGMCLFVGVILNILLAIWIFTDIRKRGEGSGIFVALALLAGIPTAIIYAIVRIGDKKT